MPKAQSALKVLKEPKAKCLERLVIRVLSGTKVLLEHKAPKAVEVRPVILAVWVMRVLLALKAPKALSATSELKVLKVIKAPKVPRGQPATSELKALKVEPAQMVI